MNCHDSQNHILNLLDPREAPKAIRAHLAECGKCRQWYRNVLLVEREAARVLVPAPTRRESFVNEFRQSESLPKSASATAPAPLARPAPPRLALRPSSSRRQKALRKIAGSFAIAAALLIAMLAWWLGGSEPNTPGPDPNKDRTANRDKVKPRKTPLEQRLAADHQWILATSTDARLLVLGRLETEIFDETLELREDSLHKLQQQVVLFKELVHDGIMKQAVVLSKERRLEILNPLAKQLEGTESRARRLAAAHREQGKLAQAKALTEIAMIANEGKIELEKLLSQV